MNLPKMKLEKELMLVTGARMDQQIRIAEMQIQIKELEKHIVVQLDKEEELKKRLKEME